MNYIDEIEWLQMYIFNQYPREEALCSPNEDAITLFRKTDSRYWASRKAIYKCSIDAEKDPLDVLEDLLNEFNVEQLFAKQEINIKHYKVCVDTITNIIDVFKKEWRR